ncbi:MAG: RRXRR domain-containing protein [Nostoc sp.]
MRLKLDPGAKVTGIALVNDTTGEVVFAAELKHRGFTIRDALTSRQQLRRGRRARKTRYRKPQFLNRTRPEGLEQKFRRAFQEVRLLGKSILLLPPSISF